MRICWAYSIHLFWVLFFFYASLIIHNPNLPKQLNALLLVLEESAPYCITPKQTYSFNSTSFGAQDCEILATLTTACQNMTNVLRGAHICFLDDNGTFYTWIKTLEGAQPRLSSHFSTSAVVGVPILNNVHSILGGTGLGNETWFQLERDAWSWKRPMKSALHALNFLYYKIMDRQVGPYGTSGFTDRRPILTQFPGFPAVRDHVAPFVKCGV